MAERRQRLRDLEEELAESYYRSLVGRTLDVLVEGADPERPGQVRGTSCRYAPVTFRGHAAALLRRRLPVHVTGVERGVLRGEPEPAADLAPRLGDRLALPLLTRPFRLPSPLDAGERGWE